jgi:serine/threonine protein kinase
MVLCCPSATLGGLVWWNILEQDQYFVVQQHKIGPPIWNPPFRILLKCNNHIVAEAKSKEELDKDLKLCQLKIQEALKERNNQPLASLTNELSTFFQNLWKEQQEIVILSSAMGNQPSSPGHPHGANSTKPTTPRKVSVTDQSKTETHKTDSKTTKAEEPKKHEPDTKKEDPKKEEKPKTPPSQKAEEKLDAAATAKLDHTPEDTSHMQKVPSNPDMLQWAKQQFDQLGEKGEETQKSVQSAELGTDSIPLELDPEDIKLGEFLGEGVYSEVYKGYCYGTQVAVKKFKNQGFDPEILKEVRKEVRIMKSLHHPNLLLFLGACTKPGHLMIVTELMEKSFHEISTSKVDLFTKLKMAKEAAKGMSWLHSLSPAIIHRDLKPENILVNQSRKAVKIADFGLSLVKDHSKQEAEEMKRIRGSPAFMSPEALLGNDLTPKTDVYSFGMILWELLTGKSPYDDLSIESFEQLIEEICEKGTREKIPDDCPPSFRKLIESCWAPLPEQRPSFLQLITQLDECILEVAIADKEGRRMWKRHFTEANMLKAEVAWEAFLSAVSLTLRMSPGLKIFQGLKSMIVRERNNCKHRRVWKRAEVVWPNDEPKRSRRQFCVQNAEFAHQAMVSW